MDHQATVVINEKAGETMAGIIWKVKDRLGC